MAGLLRSHLFCCGYSGPLTCSLYFLNNEMSIGFPFLIVYLPLCPLPHLFVNVIFSLVSEQHALTKNGPKTKQSIVEIPGWLPTGRSSSLLEEGLTCTSPLCAPSFSMQIETAKLFNIDITNEHVKSPSDDFDHIASANEP